ncbi:MAG TPA: ATP-binding protein, partial [Verrucomicrobiae bacterium]
NQVVVDTRRLLGDRFLRDTVVRFTPAAGLPLVSVPRNFIQQILLNFIFNAQEAMGQRGQIELSTQLVVQLPPTLYLPPVAAPRYILIAVRDEGAGIAAEIRDRIFEPFFTTKNLSSRRGTGLGLSMVYELAKKMGAGLAVTSEAGRGSIFTLILPVTS